jgi:hypothetical protein
MKVIIGPYNNWFGPYQLAELLCFWAKKVPDEDGILDKPRWVHNFGEWLSERKDGSNTLLHKFLLWIHSKKTRQTFVRIDNWDTWSMDHTLAHIVVPMLKQLKATKHGAPQVDDSDVPAHLQSTSAPAKENDWDVDDNHFKRWDWALDEMIWAFEQKLDDDCGDDKFYTHPTEEEKQGKSFTEQIALIKVDREGLDLWQARKRNGYRLFGKYYEALWD